MEQVRCKKQHQWNGVVPLIDPTVLIEQYPLLLNMPCDCGKYLYNSETCGCLIKERRLDYIDNPNFLP